MSFAVKLNTFFTLCASLLLSACANLGGPSASPVDGVGDAPPAIPYQELSGQSLFQLLLAEIATNRQEYGAAAALYSEIGSTYNDVAAINRAVALNQSIGNYSGMLPLAEKWLLLRPEDSTALMAHSLAAIATGQVDEGLVSLDRWLVAEPGADVSIILPAYDLLDSAQRAQLDKGLLALLVKHPESGSLPYTQARLKFVEDQPEAALLWVDRALAIEQNLQVELFRFQLLLNLERTVQAKQAIEALAHQVPSNRQVALQYSRYLFSYEPDNLPALKDLYSRFATEPSIGRTYARAAFEYQDYDSATAVYNHLLGTGYRNEANYFLGRIDLLNDLPNLAVDHFEAVIETPYLSSALAEWIALARPQDSQRILAAITAGKRAMPDLMPVLWRLQANYFQLIEQDLLAWSSLEDALQQFPGNGSLLYDQALLAAQLDRMAIMEANLIAVLKLEPNNINALNALGYSWADMNKNLDTAARYIDQALAGAPENPAFQDSKGWLLYRTGDLDQALLWLQKAYSNMKNDEVAAHLAQVLWDLKRTSEARDLLADLIRDYPGSGYIGVLTDLFNE
ncbi:tetratricopeptide repeat protein [Reinekea sp.]|jgi:tetratricopeptide (TPR) repeat protein|uniref:tetratricopeptide repeat protein n=1 Tax=Reinekea sp. TaxID=1970455 RepID=UPI002A7FECA5|nr:tetratricopeptide repeat protein [Reinekea sp.]